VAVGALDEISALLTAAALDAIDRGNEQITSASLDQCGYIRPARPAAPDDADVNLRAALPSCEQEKRHDVQASVSCS
jgi:hypothetical protein